jgi:hypothetical protein
MVATSRRLISVPRMLACLPIGLAISFAVCALLATFLFPSHWRFQKSIPPSAMPPTYLAPMAPELREITRSVPNKYPDDEPVLWGLNIGVDLVCYTYGDSIYVPDSCWWDPLVSHEPPCVALIRYRFGWPLRMMSMDEIETIADPSNSVVAEFHQRARTLAGEHRGMSRPAWLPRSIPLWRVPIAVRWGSLAVNTLVWALFCYLVLSVGGWLIRRKISGRRARRGLCTGCGYEIDGLMVCPECATPTDGKIKRVAFATPPGGTLRRERATPVASCSTPRLRRFDR